MKFAVAKEHRNYFRQNRYLELELLAPAQLDRLRQGIRQALASRLKLYPDQVQSQSPNTLFRNGRDLWRSNESVKKEAVNTAYAEIFSELIEKKRIRLGYDQFLPKQTRESGTVYANFLQNENTLAEISCIQGILGGLLLCLEGEAEEQESSLFPYAEGNGVFFTGDFPIDFSQMPPDRSYLLVTYTEATSVYIVNRADPQAHSLMDQGYSYGDRLTDKRNPVLHQ